MTIQSDPALSRGRISHELKCWPKFFTPIWNDQKLFEVRKNDRDFRVGDGLYLREYDPTANEETGSGYTGRSVIADVTHVMRPGDFGPPQLIHSDYVILSIRVTYYNPRSPIDAFGAS